jgi:hypothetical protein
MPLSIKIVTTANRTRYFHQSDASQAAKSIALIAGATSIYAAPSLLLTSALQAEVFAPRRIALIELDGESLPADRPGQSDVLITAIDPDDSAPVYDLDEASGGRFRVDFFFVGGYVLSTRVEVDNSEATFADRTRRVTQLFETPLIWYTSSGGGIGLMNPSTMTRTVITPAGGTVPADALLVDDF